MRDLTRITDEIAAQVTARAGDVMHRLSPEGRRQRDRARARRLAAARKVIGRMVLATVAILLAALAFGLVVAPLGVEGVLAVAVALILAFAGILAFSTAPAETREALGTANLPLLPARTEAWLATQRPALPAPAARLTDGIGLRLEALSPQLHGLNPADPAAAQVRKLIADDLPELIEGYKRVPEPLRAQSRDGRPSPDRQLADGLRVVDDELKRVCEQLAAGELDKLAVQGRYLELKYKDGGME